MSDTLRDALFLSKKDLAAKLMKLQSIAEKLATVHEEVDDSEVKSKIKDLYTEVLLD